MTIYLYNLTTNFHQTKPKHTNKKALTLNNTLRQRRRNKTTQQTSALPKHQTSNHTIIWQPRQTKQHRQQQPCKQISQQRKTAKPTEPRRETKPQKKEITTMNDETQTPHTKTKKQIQTPTSASTNQQTKTVIQQYYILKTYNYILVLYFLVRSLFI